MFKCLITIFFIYNGVCSFSQVNQIELNDSLIRIEGKVIYENKKRLISSEMEISYGFQGFDLKKVKIKSKPYPNKFHWIFLKESGIAFEIPLKKQNTEFIRIFYSDAELASNKIKDVKTFQGEILFNSFKITPSTTLGELKATKNFRTYEDKKLGYLSRTEGQVNYFLYFDDYEDSGKLDCIIIQMPTYYSIH